MSPFNSDRRHPCALGGCLISSMADRVVIAMSMSNTPGVLKVCQAFCKPLRTRAKLLTASQTRSIPAQRPKKIMFNIFTVGSISLLLVLPTFAPTSNIISVSEPSEMLLRRLVMNSFLIEIERGIYADS